MLECGVFPNKMFSADGGLSDADLKFGGGRDKELWRDLLSSSIISMMLTMSQFIGFLAMIWAGAFCFLRF
jgi:hypothetical protein